MYNCVHNLVPITAFFHDALDRAVDGQQVLYLPDILGFPYHRVVLGGKLQCLLETGVLRARHQETQTQIGEPGGDALYHFALPASSAAPISL